MWYNGGVNKQYVILSVERRAPNGYFVAFQGFSGCTPVFSTVDKAKRFMSKTHAKHYANKELFTTPDASVIVEIDVELPGKTLVKPTESDEPPTFAEIYRDV